MKVATPTPPVNTGGKPTDELVEIEFKLSRWLGELIEEEMRERGITLDELVTEALMERYGPRPEVAPVFLKERTVRYLRYLRECCELADVDPDAWVEDWIGTALVVCGLNGKHDVDFEGICYDLVEEHGPGGSGGMRSEAEKVDLYTKMREVAARYQAEVAAEVQQEADASMEKGDA